MRILSAFSSKVLWSTALIGFLAACGSGVGGEDKELTSAEGVEREVVIKGEVFVSATASAYSIKSAVGRQVRTAFGPLRIAKISVDDREFRNNVDPSTFVIEPATVVREADDGTLTEVKQIKRVRYTYRARGLANKQHANKESISLALLSGNYQSFVDEIIHECVEDYDHDSEFSSSFWYVFAPNEHDCRQLIADETEAIEQAREGLDPGQLPEAEYQRRFLPVTAELNPVGVAPTRYPEYHRLYGLGDATKTRIRVHAVFGMASHAGDPDHERFANDIGFAEFFKTIKVLTDEFAKLRVAEHSAFDPLTFAFDGTSYTAEDFDQLEAWAINSYGQLPEGVSSDERDAFRRRIHDHLDRRWFALEIPLAVSDGDGASKQMVLEVNLIYGTNSDYQSRNIFRKAFKQGEVVIYDGHSYIGSGPLDPSNYTPYDFRDGYQIFLFNSCVSFNYYNVDYFSHKAYGSKDLELVTNGIESYIHDGGKSMGQFIAALFDGQQNNWLQILKQTRVPWGYYGYHDPNRAVDGELDNDYDPAQTSISVSERDWDTTGGGGGGEGDVVFADDMESGANWTASGLWHRATGSSCAAPSAASGDGAFYFGDDSACTFKRDDGRAEGKLTSTTIAGLTADSKLTFKYFREVESASSGSYDKTYVQIMVGDSNQWQVVWSRDSKTASESTWLTSEPIDLGAQAGQSIKLRFVFDSVDGYANNHVGWLIDDVEITK